MGEITRIPAEPHAEFLFLGVPEIRIGGSPVPIGPAQEKRLLAAVLSEHPNPVGRSALIRAIWDPPEPEDAVENFHHIARRLRRRLENAGLRSVLPSESGGYRLGTAEATVDLQRFHALLARAARSPELGDAERAGLLEAALGLFRGEPLAGLDGQWIDGYRYLLQEERHAAEIAFNEAAIRLGDLGTAIPRLEARLRERPGDEWLAWLGMHAFYRAGRKDDAQNVYHRVRRHLDTTIATESHRALTELYELMLRGDDRLLEGSALVFPAGRSIRGAGARGSFGTGAGFGAREDPARDSDPGPEPEPEPDPTHKQSNPDPDPDPDPSPKPEPGIATGATFSQTNIGTNVHASQGGVQNFYFGGKEPS
ncbi:DNA-binding SARP family transcriptional activator [Catenulispora sp. MAP12-49]|uniref:AfsR/SARP family transcriptional regulator n=1 Tax=Catenulispora sp. MAP12-49 TaxID=3156302 RepID=UPI003514DD22